MGQGEPAGENQRTQRGARQVGIDAADQERTRHISRAQSIPTNSAQVRLGEGKGSEVPEPASEVVLDQSAGVLQGAGESGPRGVAPVGAGAESSGRTEAPVCRPCPIRIP
jgi:hypothetical protein